MHTRTHARTHARGVEQTASAVIPSHIQAVMFARQDKGRCVCNKSNWLQDIDVEGLWVRIGLRIKDLGFQDIDVVLAIAWSLFPYCSPVALALRCFTLRRCPVALSLPYVVALRCCNDVR